MSTSLLVRDETTSGQTVHESVIEFLTERVTVRELIRSRVYQEVQDYNRGADATFRGLVQPEGGIARKASTDVVGNRAIDWEVQYQRAVEAFESNQVLVLLDDRQLETLEDEIVIRPGSAVSFLKLTPLVGG
ncbi:MAG: hypothetical protein R3C01_17570 [Planctomycetaceae bacterium]